MEAMSLVAVSGFPRRCEVESICLTLANASRGGAPCAITIAALSPPTLLGSLMPTLGLSACGGSDVSRAEESSEACAISRVLPHGMVPRLRIDGNFDLRSMKWPTGLREVVLAGEYNRCLSGVRWPSGIRRLESQGIFDMPISSSSSSSNGCSPPGAARAGGSMDVSPSSSDGLRASQLFPGDLKELILGGNFNQDVRNVIWPQGLEKLKLGSAEDGFLDSDDDDGEHDTGSENEGTESRRTYPDEPSFNRPILGVTWPRQLKILEFGNRFNKPVEGASFPDSLEQILFGARFDQPIEGVRWPANMRLLRLGEDFDQNIDRVTWPGKLEGVELGGDDPCLDPNVLMDAVWPKSMRKLVFHCNVYPVIHTDLQRHTDQDQDSE